MLAVVKSVGLYGLEGYMIKVEVDVSPGLPDFRVVGLPDAAVREARERVRAAVRNSGLEFPMGRITVNLAPADFKKEGPVFDLPIAVGLLAASGQLRGNSFAKYVFLGELSLDGSIRGVTGILPCIMAVRENIKNPFVAVAHENADEAAIVGDVGVYPFTNLRQLVGFLEGREEVKPHIFDAAKLLAAAPADTIEDMAEVQGQFQVKRALEVAAAGGHNVLMTGPPGAGKTMLARRLARIIPELSFGEALEVTKIYSVAGRLKNGMSLVTERPFRAPHHNISMAGMLGGGRIPKPGEVSLAHRGLLFLDEFPEFSKYTLESLRQPLEDGRVRLSRTYGSIEYPAEFMLVAAMNPCPCGFWGDDLQECSCTPFQISRYRSRISGPLLDRIDIHIEVPRIKYRDLRGSQRAESSEKILRRVERARKIQRERFAGTGIMVNGKMGNREVRKYCQLKGKAADLMREAFEKLHLSARAYSRILKVARTIADLDGCGQISEKHIAEAIHYRSLDRFHGF